MAKRFSSVPETIKVGKFEVSARVEYDDQMGPPWEEHDGHGPVSDWTTRPKRPGERIIASDRGSYRYYNVEEAIQTAKADGWDAEPYRDNETHGQKAVKAVEADYKWLKAWCDDKWHWAGVVLSVSRGGVVLDEWAASLWGIESTADDYFVEVANELIEEAIKAGSEAVLKIMA